MPKKSDKKTNLEESLAKLEEIVARMENPAVTLDDALILYKEGIELATKLAQNLLHAEAEVSVLTERSGKIFEETFARD